MEDIADVEVVEETVVVKGPAGKKDGEKLKDLYEVDDKLDLAGAPLPSLSTRATRAACQARPSPHRPAQRP